MRLLKNLIFPFSAIVGQENVKKALILNAINPGIGGVLIKGDKGTGKTTAVRALADLLPLLKVVKGCPFNCDPDDEESACDTCKSDNAEIEEKKMRVVELPLGSTEDRVVGSINIEKALKEGTRALEPGILAEANRNILYIDEINLLDDNLVDVLLDAAAYGINIVEREGISVSHPSRFILVGTMNPAEGELRPQLSDRIGLHIIVHSIMDIEDRVEIMARREEFERDPTAFKRKFSTSQKEILDNILNARALLKDVKISPELMKIIAHVCVDMGVDGHRADIAILKTSKTIAAYNKHLKVDYDDVEEAVMLVLGERLQKSYDQKKIKQKLEKAISDTEDEDQTQEEQDNNEEDSETAENQDEKSDDNENESQEGQNEDSGLKPETEENQEEPRDKDESSEEESNVSVVPNPVEPSENPEEKKGIMLKSIEEEGDPVDSDDEEVDIKKLLKMKGKKKNRLYGKRVDSKTQKGKYIKSKIPKNVSNDIAIDATLRAAAVKSKGSINVKNEDIRHKVRKHGAKASIALVVDISGSMFSQRKANKIKGILNQLIEDINRHKDKISVIGFKGQEAEVIIPTTRRASSFKENVDNIRVGGTTPLAAGLKKGLELLKKEKIKEEFVPMMIVLTDGMPNVGINDRPAEDALKIAADLKENEIHTIIVNFERSVKYGRDMNMELALASGGRYYDLEDIKDTKCVVSQIVEQERSVL
ncbi:MULTISPECIES: VWA domain-containing protein [Methanobacterium]|uniref:VWA domain-containing protein n=1 Tax=Methanobacterium veterum TaxID=408577 RepID=A0A9E5A151_9EURY|nr:MULTISPECIES: VWA domain-containing protein [Methanobacterium]MCZ3364990.1 VWA domain-containing protein [Methanobacterium veterum]MCZ3372745.1 VWA domain-containing protein [Methanobacterium veterum]